MDDKNCVMCKRREGEYQSTAGRWFCRPCTDTLPYLDEESDKDNEIKRLTQEIETYKAWQPNSWNNAQKLSVYEEAIKNALFNLKVLNQPSIAQQILYDCLFKSGEVAE